MHIQTPDPPTKIQDHYDFTLDNGAFIPVTIDRDSGDVITFGENEIEVHLQARQSISDPNTTLPAENMFIVRHKICSYSHRVLEVSAIKPNFDPDWMKDLVSKAIN